MLLGGTSTVGAMVPEAPLRGSGRSKPHSPCSEVGVRTRRHLLRWLQGMVGTAPSPPSPPHLGPWLPGTWAQLYVPESWEGTGCPCPSTVKWGDVKPGVEAESM